MIARLSYRFHYKGQTYSSPGADIGSTINPEWFHRYGGPRNRANKWSAIHHALPDVFDALYETDTHPERLGFKFEYIEEAE